MTESRTISTAPLEHPAMDYELLRRVGIRRLEQLAGRLWTDFNTHDPGITILEQLCYAISDLGYRIDYALPDLLADAGHTAAHSLFSPAEILTCSPTTLIDVRKLLLDIVGVRNVWITPVTPEPALYYDPADARLYMEAAPHRSAVNLRGVYEVLIEPDGTRSDLELAAAVRQRLNNCRTLGEVFAPPTILGRQPITVTATVEVGPNEDPDRLLAQIYDRLACFISPRIRFYSLAEMLAQGRSIDEIMDGPPLQRGFIDDAEMPQLARKDGLRASDLIQVMMDVPGVLAVDTISLADGTRSDPWYLSLTEAGSRNSAPVLDIELPHFTTPTIRLSRNGVPIYADPGRMRNWFTLLQQRETGQPLPLDQRDIRPPAGRDRRVGRYHSIQHQFPAVYGIGPMGLPASASPERKAQAKQLKAYLLFFDQLLANSFAQLAHVKDLFSFTTAQAHTYFAQLIDEPELGLDDIWVQDRAARTASLHELVETTGVGFAGHERKQRFLNHLLARFAEEFTDYTAATFNQDAGDGVIQAKSAFLRDYRELGAARGRAFNTTQPVWDTANVSGLEKRLSLKLGLSDYRRRDLADLAADDPGGFHLVESILLRPHLNDQAHWLSTSDTVGWQSAVLLALPDGNSSIAGNDPFSLRLCFVFPRWIRRFEPEFVERILREEAPAHLDLHVQWLDREQMGRFESGYKAWLQSLLAQPALDTIPIRAARDHLIDLLRIANPYPLRDLRVSYQDIVALNQAAEINLHDAQLGVRYQLCDEEGNPILDAAGRDVIAERPIEQAEPTLKLFTPPITADVTYTILALREADAYGFALPEPLEIYLTSVIALRVGINTGLPVVFLPSAMQIGQNAQIVVNYGDGVQVAIDDTQEGISYVLVAVDGTSELSEPVEGNLARIVLTANADQPFHEDSTLRVRAYRTLERTNTDLLDAELTVLVRPNPAVAVTLQPADPPVIDYGAAARFVLPDAQASVEYQLYRRNLVAADYVAADTPGRMSVGDTAVSIAAPAAIGNWDNPAGLTLVGTFTTARRTVRIDAEGLQEDTLFVVLATKRDNRERLQLAQAVVILVRPDPKPSVTVQEASVTSGSEGMVIVGDTQQGVRYQLLVGATPINLPGYDYRDRALETSRIAVDFVVEAPDDPAAARSLLLPAGPITKKTTFRVLATKILSEISAELEATATISRKRGSSDGAPATEGDPVPEGDT